MPAVPNNRSQRFSFASAKPALLLITLFVRVGVPVSVSRFSRHLLAKLIAGCHGQRLHDLHIVLPFEPVTRRVDLRIEREWSRLTPVTRLRSTVPELVVKLSVARAKVNLCDHQFVIGCV